ncbi:hypothetical protein ACJA88_003311 [Fusarium oxysporum]
MPSLVPTPSLSSKIYKAVISPFQKLQLLFPRVSGTFGVNFTAQDARRLLRLKAEIGGPSKEFDTTNCATTTFHKFNGLPVELRTMIWRLYNISPGNVPSGDIPCVQNVAVDWPSGDGTDMGEVIDDIWCMFLDCKKVLFVMRHHPLPDTDVRITKVKENDDINIEYEKTGGNGDTSGHNFVIHGQLIASVARQKWRQWRLCLFAMKLTPLEPVLEYVQE